MDGEGLSGPYIDLLQDLFDPTKKGAITLIDLSPGPVVANQKKDTKSLSGNECDSTNTSEAMISTPSIRMGMPFPSLTALVICCHTSVSL